MKVGTLCYATNQGLGILAKSFYDHGIVTHPLVVKHHSHPCHAAEWYPGAPVVPIRNLYKDTVLDAAGSGPLGLRRVMDFCAEMDVMLFFETPFCYDLIDSCRARGVKTILCPMYECFHQENLRHLPDLFLCPSALDFQYFQGLATDKLVVQLPVPVEVPWRQRTRAEVFVHNAGHGGLRGRNGTLELMHALQLIKSPAKFIIRRQSQFRNTTDEYWTPLEDDPRITFHSGTIPHDQLWAEGDVFVFPEKFNGLSLPLQEARAAGMLVMGTDRFPINTWLPNSIALRWDDAHTLIEREGDTARICPTTKPLLIKPERYDRARIGPPYPEFDEAVLDPREIAATIDSWYGADITTYSQEGKEWARDMSWEVLGPKYHTLLEGLVNS